MDAKVTWQTGLTFTGVADSGHPIQLTGDSSVNAPGPMELVAISLAGCTAMDVISILKKKQQDVTNFEVHVQADRSEEYPKVYTKAVMEYVVSGRGVDESALLRAVELSMTKYCPVHAMLSRAFPIEVHYAIYEAEEPGKSHLVKRGKYEHPD